MRKSTDTTKPPRKQQRPHLRLVQPPPAAPAEPLVFDLAEWAPIDEAYARAKAALGWRALAEHDLCAHLRDGRINSAVRSLRRDGGHAFGLLPQALWRDLRLQEGLKLGPDGTTPVDSGKVRVTAARDSEAAKMLALARAWWFFVARRDLDRLYPIGGPEAADARRQPPQTGRKPGRRPAYDWPKVVFKELYRRALVGEAIPTAPEMIAHCEKELPGAYSPGLKEMQILLRDLLSQRS